MCLFGTVIDRCKGDYIFAKKKYLYEGKSSLYLDIQDVAKLLRLKENKKGQRHAPTSKKKIE